MAEPNPAAVELYGTEEQMVAALVARGEHRDVALEQAALAFGSSEGDIVDLSPIPPANPSA